MTLSKMLVTITLLLFATTLNAQQKETKIFGKVLMGITP